jgi:hypothetical protein
MPDKAIMTVQSENGPPTLEAAARQLGVVMEAVDASYGVVPIDPKRGLYSVQVDAALLPNESPTDEPYRGPFSNPRIEPFGRPAGDESAASKKRSE